MSVLAHQAEPAMPVEPWLALERAGTNRVDAVFVRSAQQSRYLAALLEVTLVEKPGFSGLLLFGTAAIRCLFAYRPVRSQFAIDWLGSAWPLRTRLCRAASYRPGLLLLSLTRCDKIEGRAVP
jgi:hypothetical protein